MVAKVGLTAQVSLGTTTTKTYNISWAIPAYSSYRIRAGSRWVKAIGTEEYINQEGKVVHSKSVTGNWSYQTWSNKVRQ